MRGSVYLVLVAAICGALRYYYYYGWKPKGELTMGRVRRMEIWLAILGILIFFAIVGLVRLALGPLAPRFLFP